MRAKGLININPESYTILSSYIKTSYARSRSLMYRIQVRFGLRKNQVHYVTKDQLSWMLSFSQKEGPKLDKFIHPAALEGSCIHISHKCHNYCCLKAAHLEQVTLRENHNRLGFCPPSPSWGDGVRSAPKACCMSR